jgi:hypothetical protein
MVCQLSQCGSGVAIHIPRDILQIAVVPVVALDLGGRKGVRRRVWNAGKEQADEGVERGIQGLVGGVQSPDVFREPVEG